jgi:uncharacterized protein (DUF362 family)
MKRRRFVKQAALGLAGSLLGATFLAGAVPKKKKTAPKPKVAPKAKAQDTKPRSKVIIITGDKVFKAPAGLDQTIIRQMLDSGMLALIAKPSPPEAWASLFSPQDCVGIKVNCINGPDTIYNLQLVYAVAEELLKAGVKENNIIIFERSGKDLEKGGFTINTSSQGIRCFGNEVVGYEEFPADLDGVKIRISKIASQLCTALVNMPVLKAHEGVGISCAIKNYMGAIDQPKALHDQGVYRCADLYHDDVFFKKTKLIVADCLKPGYHSNGIDIRPYQWNCNSIMLSMDPVTCDAVGLELINEKRTAIKAKWVVDPPPRHIARAVELGLGKNKKEDIEEVRIVLGDHKAENKNR